MKRVMLLLTIVIHNCNSVSFISKFQQHDYRIKNLRMEMVRYDENFFRVMKITPFKYYNRTTTAHNITFCTKKPLGRDLQFIIQAYKFLSNEYRKIQLRFQITACEALDYNLFGLKVGLSKCGNVTQCYFYKDTVYHACNFMIDETKFPPFLPTGEYRFSFNQIYLDQDIGHFYIYLEVYRPIYPKDKK